MSSTYVAIRDDKSFRSVSLNERDFLQTGAHGQTILRPDGRKSDEIRQVRMKLGRWDNGAECTVQWGVGTRVTSLCTAELVPPAPDRPNEGIVNFTVDLSPMAGTSFRQSSSVSTAPTATNAATTRGLQFSDKNQRLLSNRVLRSVERIVLLGGALDAEALVLMPGSWVWRITIALTLLDDGGNVLDACVMAAMAALRHYRKPQVEIDHSASESGISQVLPRLIPTALKVPTPLPLHHTPLSISFALLPSVHLGSDTCVAILVDPEKREELIQVGALSIAMNIHKEVCLLDFGGGHELGLRKLKECLTMASIAITHLCEEFEAALQRADEVARNETLQLLQLKENGNAPSLYGEPKDTREHPYIQTSHSQGSIGLIATETQVEKEEKAYMNIVAKEADDAYRLQALDYTKGHVTTSVREDEVDNAQELHNSSLFATLLKAATDCEPPSANPFQQLPRDQDVNGRPSFGPSTELLLNSNGTDQQGSSQDGPKDRNQKDRRNSFVDVIEHENDTAVVKGYGSANHEVNGAMIGKSVETSSETDMVIDDLAFTLKKKKKDKRPLRTKK